MAYNIELLAGTSGTRVTPSNKLVDNADGKLYNAREPLAHAGTHASGGSDPVTPAAIGAATAAQGALADSAVQPTGTPVASQLAYWTTEQILAGANLVSCDATNSRIGIGTLAPLGALHVVGNGLTAHDFPGFVATDDGRSKTLGVQGDTFAYLVGYTADKSFACGISTVGKAFAGSITAHDFDLRRENVAKITLTADGATLPAETASRVVCLDANKTLKSSSVTTTELESLTGIEGNIQDLLEAESSARLEAGIGLQSTMPTIRGVTYNGGFSGFAASAARAGWLDYGGADLGRIMLTGTGVGIVHDMSPLRVETLDPVDDYVRFKVSIELDTGTLVMQTTTRPMPLAAYRHFGVLSASGTVSSSSITVCVGSEVFTLANGGLEVVGTSYTGTPISGTGAWTLCADAAGTNTLSCRVASDGWHALNYPLTSAHWADWLATGRLPFEGGGGQFVKSALAWSFGDFDAAAASSSSLITENCMTAAELGARTDGAGSYVLRGTSLAATYYAVRFVVPSFPSYKVRFWARSSVSTTLNFKLIAGGGDPLATAALTTEWQYIETELTSTGTTTEFIRCYILSPSVDDWFEVDDVLITASGEMISGLDLSAQPVCSRTASGAVLLDSASGVELTPYTRPERMALATQLPMTASGYLLGDRLVHPAGYVVDKVLVANKGSASATVTLRAGLSGGAVMATATVAATGLPVALAISSLSALTATGGKIYVTGAATTSPITITVILVRA